MTIDRGVISRHLGPVTIVALTLGYVLLWLVLKPATEPGAAYAGQLVGAVSVLLLSSALVLISSLPWVEALGLPVRSRADAPGIRQEPARGGRQVRPDPPRVRRLAVRPSGAGTVCP